MRISAIIFVFFFLSCKQKLSDGSGLIFDIYQSDFNTSIVDAKGFDIIENDSLFILKVKSLSDKYPFHDSLIFSKKTLKQPGKFWQRNWRRIACQSTTHLAFLNALESIDKVVAVSDIAFMPKDELYQKIIDQKVVELNRNNAIDLEHLVNIQPDLFLMYPFEWKSDVYKSANVKTLLVSEYLEQTPIARLEWIKFFGLLVGKAEQADSIFKAVKNNYQSIIPKDKHHKTVFFNLPFKDVWDMPAPNSLTGHLIKDAGFNYLYDEIDNKTDNLSFLKETVWAKVHDADYWVIIANRPANYSMEALLLEAPVYSTFRAVKNNHVIFCNTAQTSYFTLGVLEPDIILKDLLFLTDQIPSHQPKYFQLLR